MWLCIRLVVIAAVVPPCDGTTVVLAVMPFMAQFMVMVVAV